MNLTEEQMLIVCKISKLAGMLFGEHPESDGLCEVLHADKDGITIGSYGCAVSLKIKIRKEAQQ